jgi:hypothetical protein
VIVGSVMPVAIIRRRSYDCAKLNASQALDYLVHVTLDYSKGFVAQMQNKSK